MIIGFDGRYAEGDLVGVGKYIQNLVSGVAKKEQTCIVFYSKKPKYTISNAKPVMLKSINRYHFEQVLLPLALKEHKVDVYHATGNMGVPVFCPVPSVLTVHDIIPLEIQDYFSYSPSPVLSKLSYLVRLKSSLAKAAKIITVSDFVKHELIKKLNIKPERIQTLYSGAPVVAVPGKLPSKLVGKKYILNHGGIDIRKNLNRLIEAFAKVRGEHPQLNLVITGENKRLKADLSNLISKLKLDGSVIFTGYVDEKTLSAIIKNALMECYPTLSEGFGFPILECFALETPVISSNISAIPEVAGKAAILIDPKNIDQISNAIKKVLKEPRLVKDMVKKGKAEYNKFSWKKSVNDYLDLYNNVQ